MNFYTYHFLFHRKVEICMFNFIFQSKCKDSDSAVPDVGRLYLFLEQFVYESGTIKAALNRQV